MQVDCLACSRGFLVETDGTLCSYIWNDARYEIDEALREGRELQYKIYVQLS
jgi:hypothetical protein